MKIEELYKEVENIKTNIWNGKHKELLRKEYQKMSNKDLIDILEMITKDVDKLLGKLRFEIKIEFEIKERQKDKAKFVKELLNSEEK